MTGRTAPRRRAITRRGGLLAFSLAFLLTLVVIPATASAYIYWNSGGHIGRANLDGTGANAQWLNTNTTDIGALAVDSNRLYWSFRTASQRQIGRVNVDGTGINLNAVPGVGGQAIVWGVAVDTAHIWFTTTGSGAIGRANLDGTGLATPFIPGVDAGAHLTVDGAHLYWTSAAGDAIGSADLDGDPANPSLISGLSNARGIAVSANHIYWANWQANTIGRANLDGTGANPSFISTAGAPTSVAVEGNHVFWSNSGNVGRATLGGAGVNTAFVPGVGADEIAVAPDIEPPSLTIDSGPNGPTTNQTPTFGFTAGADATSVTCSIDKGVLSFGACSGASLHTPASALPDDSYTFRVKASDAIGNSVTLTRPFRVDTTLPTTTISSGPSGPTNDPTFSFGSNEVGATFECRLGTGPWVSCPSPKTFTGIADGPHTVEVRATDTAGNVATATDSRSFTLDQTAPGTTITSAPPLFTNDPTPTYTFTSNDPTATFQCSLELGAFGTCASPVSTGPLTDGVHYFEVRAVDAVGNADPTAESGLVLVDTVAPDFSIVSGPSGATTNSQVIFVFAGGGAPAPTFECSIDTGTPAYVPCAGSYVPGVELAPGAYTFHLRATDAAGNQAVKTGTFSIAGTTGPDPTGPDPTGPDPTGPDTTAPGPDTTAPMTTITKTPKSKIKAKGKKAKVGVSFSSEAGATFECQLDKAAFAPCTSPFSVSAKAKKGKGAKHTISIRATDAAGNVGTPATVNFKVVRKAKKKHK